MAKSDYRSRRNNGRPEPGIPGPGVPTLYNISAQPPAAGRPNILCNAWLTSNPLVTFEGIDVWRDAAQFSENDCQLFFNTNRIPVNFVLTSGNEMVVEFGEVFPGDYEFWIRPGGRSFTSVHGILCAGVSGSFLW